MNGFEPHLVLLAVLVLISGFFSGSETAIFSLGRARREALAQSGLQSERIVAGLLRRPGRLIAAILLGNELVSIAASAVATVVLRDYIPADTPRLWANAVTTAIVAMVLVVVGEVVPKSIGIKIPRAWSRVAARPLVLFATLSTPLMAVVRAFTGLFAWPFGVRGPDADDPKLHEAEFRSLVDVGQQEGALRGEERRLIQDVFEFGDTPVGFVMTPADEVFALSYDLPLGRIVDAVAQSHHGRVPIYRGRRDNIVGILLAKDLVGHARGMLASRGLSDLLLPPFYVPKASRCDEVFRQMQRRRNQLAIVVDEYGRTVGLVTMEDLLDELFGSLHEGGGEPTPAPADAPDVAGTPGTPEGKPR